MTPFTNYVSSNTRTWSIDRIFSKEHFYGKSIQKICTNTTSLFNFDQKLKTKQQMHMKFEYEMSKTEIDFLDIIVLEVDNKLRGKMYFKPTDRQTYLHSKSEHPNSTKKSIANSQALRFNKICYSRTNLIEAIEAIVINYFYESILNKRYIT